MDVPQAPPLASTYPRAFAAAYERSGAGRWGVGFAALSTAIRSAVAHRFAGGAAAPAEKDVETFILSLHVEDLALACACADGHPEAWDHFVRTYRPELYRAARAMTGESAGRELADSLYAELYGLPGADGRRRSLFAYYHGRSKLATWLRSVLAQRHVDRIREEQRTTPLDDPEEVAAGLPAEPQSADPGRAARAAALSASIAEGIDALEPGDRLRLAYYYVHELTLAEIGRLCAEHEATVSRKLDRARKRLRAAIEGGLRQRGIDPAEIDDWGHAARHDWTGEVADLLGDRPLQADSSGSFKGRAP
jgi:RNA polymerase sigma-70 factor (ECF subfamily)